jgi:hypothetical protein
MPFAEPERHLGATIGAEAEERATLAQHFASCRLPDAFYEFSNTYEALSSSALRNLV